VSSEEMRKKEIEESKYLGGDMEHTHLVKGLDYSLLHKIRSELEKEKRMEAYVPHLNPHI
jgi:IK cytokine